MTRTQLQDAFDKLKARVNFAGGETRATVTIETTRENLPEVMKLVATALRKPDFPAAELEQLKNERATDIEEKRREPDDLARNVMARTGNPYPKGDVRHELTMDEQIDAVKAVTLERVKAFHRDFYGAGNAEFAAVGDFDAAALRAQLEQLFGDWKSAKPYARVPQPVYAVPAGENRLQTPDKANAYFMAQMRFPLKDDAPDYAAALVAARIVGGGTGSILWKRIREKDGTSYGVGAGINASSHEPHATFTAAAIYAPQNVKRLEDAFAEEIGRVVKDGFTEAELKDGKNGLAQARRLSLAQDRDLALALTNQLELGRTMDYVARIDREIEAVTLEQANAAFRRYVDPAKLARVFAGDWTKK